MKRRSFAFLCILMMMTVLAGCGQKLFTDSGSPSSVILPEPEGKTVQVGTGDMRTAYSRRVILYYAGQDGSLSSELRLIHVYSDDNLAELVARALFVKPYYSSGLTSVIPDGVELLACEVSGDVAVLDFSRDILSVGEEALSVMRSAVTSTLLGLDGIRCVDILTEGMALELAGLPAGAETRVDLDAPAVYLQRMSEKMRIENGNGAVERTALLYVPADSGSLVVPEKKTVRLSGGDALERLMEAYSARCLLPGAAISSTSYLDEDGSRIAEISLTDVEDAESFVPSITMTVCGFVPNIDYVCVVSDGDAVTKAAGLISEKGLWKYTDFRYLTGRPIRLYTGGKDASLCRLDTVLGGRTVTVRDVLNELFTTDVFPGTASPADILGIRIEDRTAYINISPALYSLCQELSAEEEKILVYSIVNSVCENIDIVDSVGILVSDERVETLSGNISLISPLMPNPGLVTG